MVDMTGAPELAINQSTRTSFWCFWWSIDVIFKMADTVREDDSEENDRNLQLIPDLETQKQEIGELLKTPLKTGDTWYLIECHWLKQWKKYVGFDSWDVYGIGDQINNPGPLDNSNLFKDDDANWTLKEHLIDELYYYLVPEEAWNKLVFWYGIVENQPPIARKVVENGMYVKHCKVEVYLIEFKLCENSSMDEVVTRQFSKADTLEHIEIVMKEIFNIDKEAETRLWNKYMRNKFELLGNKQQTVQDVGLYQGQMLIIEKKNEDGSWQRTNTKSSYSSSTITSSSESSSSYGSSSSGSTGHYGSGSYWNMYWYESAQSRSKPGLCGLGNIGNTCFMNSGLQCLSNTMRLTKYFLSEQYKSELNFDNPLGMKGEIAKAYAELLSQLWSGNYSSVIPRNFKMQVGRFAPQYSGYQQQDSHELLAFLLDGLHEDLNRIKKKPYIEVEDANGRPDEDVAREAWTNHRQRNDSIIVDIFHGQFKSTLVCPDCEKVSVTFDPFCYLSLPLPVKKERNIAVLLVRDDPLEKPTKYRLTVPKMGNISNLLNALCKEDPSLQKERLVVCDVYNHRLHKMFKPAESLTQILERDDIIVYELGLNCEDPDMITIPVYSRVRRPGTVNYSSSKVLFGNPIFVTVPKTNVTFDTLYSTVLNKMRRFLNLYEETTEDESPTENGDVQMDNLSDGSDEELEKEYKKQAAFNENVEENADDKKSKSSKLNIQKQRLFHLTFVNAYGTNDIQSVMDDDMPIKLPSQSYLSLDWNLKTKDKHYNSQLAEENKEHDSMIRKASNQNNVVALSDCIKLFSSKEKLGINDLWYCPDCKKHQQAYKKMDLWSLPEVLVIHLKRFSYTSFWRDKIDVLVDFPTSGLDMSCYLSSTNAPPSVYDLIAVSNHYGGMGGGHYTAYARNHEDDRWYSYDDSSVVQISASQIVSKAAYVLFYQRRKTVVTSPQSSKGYSNDNMEH